MKGLLGPGNQARCNSTPPCPALPPPNLPCPFPICPVPTPLPLPPCSIPAWIRWLHYLSLFYWGYSSLMINEVGGADAGGRVGPLRTHDQRGGWGQAVRAGSGLVAAAC